MRLYADVSSGSRVERKTGHVQRTCIRASKVNVSHLVHYLFPPISIILLCKMSFFIKKTYVFILGYDMFVCFI